MRATRRTVVHGAGAALVTGFLPGVRSWAVADELGPGAVPIPPLDGLLVLGGEALDEAAADFGRIVSRRPWAVLLPGSVSDVQRMVAFADLHRIGIGGMGRLGDSHSTFGQAQVEAGVVIDMSRLDTIHGIDGDSVVVDAGVRWLDLLEATTPVGKSPPTLTDYLGLSVGGTLAVGGIGGQAFRAGFQTDNVLELEVVTATGELVRCSPRRHAALFAAVRAGLGQFAVIVRARLRLEDVPPEARTYTALYGDIATFTQDQETLLRDGRFDYLEGQVLADGAGGWLYLLDATRYHAVDRSPDDLALLSGLSFIPGTEAAESTSFFEFANRLAPIVEFLKQIGLWQLPHPWINMFVPASEVTTFVPGVLAGETPESTGQGVLLLYPCLRSRVSTPFLALPDSEIFYLFAILRNTVPPFDNDALVARNREIHDRLTAIGGKHYPVGSIPLDLVDWRRHYGAQWPAFALAKRLYDPHRILAPGQGIFD